MTPAQTAAITRATKLIPNLGRENDNEVVVAARAIARALAGVGLDWHDLATLIRPDRSRRAAAAPRRAKPAPPDSPVPPQASKPAFRRDDPVRGERIRASAFQTPFVPFPVSDALRREIWPRRAELTDEDRAVFDRASAKLKRGEMLVPHVHGLLIEIVGRLRAAA